MKYIFNILTLIFLFSTFLNFRVYAQQWQIAKHAGSNGNDLTSTFLPDQNGNLYAGGFFSGTGHFDSNTVFCNGFRDYFLAKYNASGEIIWLRTGGGNGVQLGESGDGITDLIIGNQNSIYISGYFDGITSFGCQTLSSYGKIDGVVAKYDTSGACIWARNFGGWESDGGQCIEIDNYGSLYTSGYSSFSPILHTQDSDLVLNGHGFFLLKYDIDGNFKWIRTIEGNGSLYVIDMVQIGNSMLLSGNFKGEMVYDTISFTTQKQFQPILLKVDTAGSCIWGLTFECTNYAEIHATKVTDSGILYCCGYANGRFTVGNDTLENGGGFLLKLNPDGSPVWLRQAGYNASDLSISSTGIIFLTGTFTGTQYFSDCEVTATGSNPNLYIAKINSDGECLGVTQVPNIYKVYQIELDAQDQCYVAGSGKATEFGSIPLGNYGEMDAFWAKLDYVSGEAENNFPPGTGLSIYANPNTGIFHVKIPKEVENEKELVLRIFDGSNRLVKEQNLNMTEENPRIDVPHAKAGLYFLQLLGKNKVYSGKMVVE